MIGVQHVKSTRMLTKPTVLVIEDDNQLQGLLKSQLTTIGFDVLAATSESDVKRFLVDPKYDLVLLDLAIDGDPFKGFDLVPKIRESRNVPIVVISGHSKPGVRLRALEMGVDEYIVKPFLMREVEIWVKRLVNSYGAKEQGAVSREIVISFAGFRLDPVRRTVQTSQNVEIDLTETEFNVLRYLLYSAGRIVTRNELWRALRGQALSPLDRALDGHVSRLRAKLEPGVERPTIIKSARGIGYVIAVPVSRDLT